MNSIFLLQRAGRSKAAEDVSYGFNVRKKQDARKWCDAAMQHRWPAPPHNKARRADFATLIVGKAIGDGQVKVVSCNEAPELIGGFIATRFHVNQLGFITSKGFFRIGKRDFAQYCYFFK